MRFRFLGNALPVLAVRDTKGWHLDPYELIAESCCTLAGDFQVTPDHPSTLEVAATGRTSTGPGTPGRTLTYSVAHTVYGTSRGRQVCSARSAAVTPTAGSTS